MNTMRLKSVQMTRCRVRQILTLAVSLVCMPVMAISPENPTAVPRHIKNNPDAGKLVCKVMDLELIGEYVGSCDDNGMADGYATIRSKKGRASYTGQFKNGMKNGFGLKTWPNGDVYAGTFLNDYKEGEGIYRWGDESPSRGDVYIGQFRRDLRWGLGTYHWANGDVFSGEWQADKYLGVATTMQQIQIKHDQALALAMQPGATVCRNLNPPDVPGPDLIIGRVKELQGDILFVDIVRGKRPDGAASRSMTDDYRNWTPCDIEAVDALRNSGKLQTND